MMTNNNNQNMRPKHKLNIVDLIMFVLILAILAVGLILVDPFDWFKEEATVEEKTVVYVLELKNVEEGYINKFYINDTVQSSDTFGNQPNVAGRIVDVHHSLEKEEVYSDGTSDASSIKRYYTVWLTIKVQVTHQIGVGYFINGQQLTVGMPIKQVSFSNVYKQLDGYCVSIEVLD